MSNSVVFSNARIVLNDRIIKGSLVIEAGKIKSIDEGASSVGLDMENDLLIAGLVELHTDHLETHYCPRPGLRWHKMSAVQSHDAQIASSGITTVFDCLRMGSDEEDGFQAGEMRELADALAAASVEGRLRADHLLHLRCEVSSHDVVQHFMDFAADPHVRLVSLMDHAPGQRQFQTMDQYILYYKIKRGLSDIEFDRFVARRKQASALYSTPNRDVIVAHCREQGITVASHDDATLEHVDEAIGYGVKLAEFPTSIEAAKASHDAGMSVLMGAPNIVRGKSHSGNIAARDLAIAGTLDVLSSDYVPFSLIQAPFILADECEEISLPQALAMVTSTPAKTVGLGDRGQIAVGLRGDVVRVRRNLGTPIVLGVWREGRRVC